MDDHVVDLAERLSGWVGDQLAGFNPWHTPGGTTPTSLQRFAELAIAYDALDLSPLSSIVDDARWRQFIEQHVTDRGFAELARSNLQWAWALLLPYLVLRKRGLRDSYHDETLRLARHAGFPECLEVVPYRALDYAYFMEAAGFDSWNGDDRRALLARTFAAKARCRYLVGKQNAYALTHSIFYASAFGAELIPAGVLPDAAKLVDSMIIDSCVLREYDVLGELLICSVALQGCTPDARELGMSVFTDALDGSGGLFPNATVTVPSIDNCYHTTLVGLILCASLARQNCSITFSYPPTQLLRR